MKITIINPKNNSPLKLNNEKMEDLFGSSFPIINGVVRFADSENYTNNFGVQWNSFAETQLDNDSDGLDLSTRRLFAETAWNREELSGQNILEVGSGAGRFSRVLLEQTKANLYSVDYSDAVTANYNNNSKIAPERFNLFQASIYEMPFLDNSFDKVVCLGVLQHTPDFNLSIRELVAKAKPGAEIVVDFYPIMGWWTKLHAKYFFRSFTTNMNHKSLMSIILNNVDWLINLSLFLHKIGLGMMIRFLPIVDIRTLPLSNLDREKLRQWVLLDTFDMFSPVYDNPKKIEDVSRMFEHEGAKVTFAGFVEYGQGAKAAVVRAVKKAV